MYVPLHPFCHRTGHLILFALTFRGGLGVTDGFLPL